MWTKKWKFILQEVEWENIKREKGFKSHLCSEDGECQDYKMIFCGKTRKLWSKLMVLSKSNGRPGSLLVISYFKILHDHKLWVWSRIDKKECLLVVETKKMQLSFEKFYHKELCSVYDMYFYCCHRRPAVHRKKQKISLDHLAGYGNSQHPY